MCTDKIQVINISTSLSSLCKDFMVQNLLSDKFKPYDF